MSRGGQTSRLQDTLTLGWVYEVGKSEDPQEMSMDVRLWGLTWGFQKFISPTPHKKIEARIPSLEFYF